MNIRKIKLLICAVSLTFIPFLGFAQGSPIGKGSMQANF